MGQAARRSGPIERRSYSAAALMRGHPPVIHNPNKQIVLDIACPPEAAHSGTLEYSRWARMPLPALDDAAASAGLVAVRDGFFSYEPFLPGAAEWHVNFADPVLFGWYGGWAMAQDEMQVAEHPALAALRQALLAERLPAVTVEEGQPTPVLVAGVQRRVRIATEPNPDEGRPAGLYGHNFRESRPEQVRRAVTVIDPPTVTNVIAIAAPAHGRGRYEPAQIEYTLATAYTGFRAAVLESSRIAAPNAPVVIHSGFWGAGAFGGNPVFMSLVQVLAARMAGVGRLVCYAGVPSRLRSLELALGQVRTLTERPLAPHEIVARIDDIGYHWGASDGN